MQELVTTHDGQPMTTSLIIAEGVGNQHKNVLELIRNNIEDFEEFGGVAFETRVAGQSPNPTKFAILNREHAMLLMTYMRNTQIVRAFKKNLIKAFVEMENQIAAKPAFDPSTLTRADILQIALNAEEERLALEAKNKELSPKAEAYESFIDAEGKYSVGAVAKMLGMGQNKLFRELRNAGVLIAKGHLYNTPYQKYMHHFDVKARTITHADGRESVKHTTYVQPSGIDFIRKKLGLQTIDPLPTLAGAA